MAHPDTARRQLQRRNAFHYPSTVIELSSESFEKDVKVGYWFIEFYSPTCPHCKRFAPLMIEIANKAMSSDPESIKSKFGQFRVGAVNCIDNDHLCDLQEIDLYPSIRVYNKATKVYQPFVGARTVDEVLKFIEITLKSFSKASTTEPPKEIPTIQKPPTIKNDEINASLKTFNKRVPQKAAGNIIELFASNFDKETKLDTWLIALYDTSSSKKKEVEDIMQKVCSMLTSRVTCGHLDPVEDPTLVKKIMRSYDKFPLAVTFISYGSGRTRQYQGLLTAKALYDFAMATAYQKFSVVAKKQDVDDSLHNYQVSILLSLSSSKSNKKITDLVFNSVRSLVTPATMCFLASSAPELAIYGNSIVVYRLGYDKPSVLNLENVLARKNLGRKRRKFTKGDENEDLNAVANPNDLSPEEVVRDFIYSRRFALVPVFEEDSAYDLMHPDSAFGENSDESLYSSGNQGNDLGLFDRDVIVLGAFDPYAEIGEMRELEEVALETRSRVAWVNGLRFSAYLWYRFRIKIGDLPKVIICAPSRSLFFKEREGKPIEFKKRKILAAVSEVRNALWADMPSKFKAEKVGAYGKDGGESIIPLGANGAMYNLGGRSWGYDHPLLYILIVIVGFFLLMFVCARCLNLRYRFAGYRKTE